MMLMMVSENILQLLFEVHRRMKDLSCRSHVILRCSQYLFSILIAQHLCYTSHSRVEI